MKFLMIMGVSVLLLYLFISALGIYYTALLYLAMFAIGALILLLHK